MSWDENHVDPSKINSSSLRTRPIPPVTPPWNVLVSRETLHGQIRNAVRIDPPPGVPVLGRINQDPGNEHAYLCKTLCKTGKFTKSFDGIQFSRMEFYQRSLIRVMTLRAAQGHIAQVPNRRVEDSQPNPDGIVGFSNFWHKVRTPYTKVYFFVVDPAFQRKGIAEKLWEDVEWNSPHPHFELEVNLTNPGALAFWQSVGFKVIHEEALKGTCYYMTKDNPRFGKAS